MISRQLATGCALMVLIAAVNRPAAAATFQAVGIYDAPSNSNTVDDDVPFGSITTFPTTVSGSFLVDFGGVIDFETGFTPSGNPTNIGTSFDVSYGASQTKELTFTTDVDMLVWTNDTAGQVEPLTGSHNLLPVDNQVQWELNIGPIVNGAEGEIVTQIGFTVLSRDPGGSNPSGADVEVTALFSDGSTLTLSENVDDEIGTDDTFFLFTAPFGESIEKLSFDNLSTEGTPNQRRLPIDDLAFVTTVVPEPSSLMLIALGLPMLRRRARRTASQRLQGRK